GIIVLPDLFDGKKLHYKEEVASIPLKPLVDENPEVFEILEPVVDEVSLPDAPVEATIDESEPQQAIVTEAEPIEVTPEPEVVDVI
ncbi:cell division protein DedD, partial [Vibrio campbellii]